MDFIILGSGGGTPTPRPFCQCKVCNAARNGKGKRNHCVAFLSEANILFDCGEDVKESLNAQNVKRVDAVFLSHWHPDHVLGLRDVVESNYDFYSKKPEHPITVFLSGRTLGTLKEKFAMIEFFVNAYAGSGFVVFEHGQKIKIKNAEITPIGFSGADSEIFGFLIEANGERLFYSPCDTISLREEFIPQNIDFWVTQCGMFAGYKSEISFSALVDRIKRFKPKQAILTHIEEVEVQKAGAGILKKLEKENKALNLRFAFDGMKIKL